MRVRSRPWLALRCLRVTHWAESLIQAPGAWPWRRRERRLALRWQCGASTAGPSWLVAQFPAPLRGADEAGDVVGDRVENVQAGRVVAENEEVQRQPVGHR